MNSSTTLTMRQEMKTRRAFQESVYSALYDYTQKNAHSAQIEMAVSKKCFISTTRQHPNCVDLSDFADLDDNTCIETIYWSLLNRVPVFSEWIEWEKYARRKNSPKFRKKLFSRLSYGFEARTKKVRSVSATFEGLAHIDCFQYDTNRGNTISNGILWLLIPIEESILGLLYSIYCATLRPACMKFRKNRQIKNEAASKMEGEK